ncbi:MAG: hypothetical protein LQ346_004315 [Caloplaca aetnensis]|nr:MAG: hypothetical protein LQ346_004315 [Caloplaca aetnensis]
MPRTARQPKLRSSCDGCGTAKLKCDRAQPVCGRCQSQDLVCVYGVSRKTGKPPREPLRAPQALDTSRACANPGSGADRKERNHSCGGLGTAGYAFDGIAPDPEQVLPGYPNRLGISVNPLDTTQPDHFWPLLPNFAPLAFDDGLFADMGPGSILNTLTTSEPDSYAPPPPPPPATEPDPPQTQLDDERRDLNGILLQPADSKVSHDCFRETLDILASLSSHRLNDAPNSPTSLASLTVSPSTSGTATPVPLDHVLRLNRDASERLARLLTCSCAGFPQLTMLYASIISHILIGYQHAAACTESPPSWNPAETTMADPAPVLQHSQSLHSSTPSSSSTSWPSSAWSSTAGSVSGIGSIENSPMSITSPPEPVVAASAKMAIGSFDIDDLRVQTALKIQLLSGEVKRVGGLIDHFALHNLDGQCMTDEYTFSGVHGLHQSLGAWLRSEHSRIANMMKAKLREYNT